MNMLFEVKNHKALQDAADAFCVFLTERNVSEERIFDSRLVVFELVGNVLKHSHGTAQVRLEILSDGFIELKVFSALPFCPPTESRLSDPYAEGGRGLFIVDNVCAERTFTDDGAIRVLIKIN